MYDTDYYEDINFEYDADGDRVDNRNQKIKRLQIQLDDIASKELREEKLRSKHPGLKDAWEKYQSILRLVDNA